MALPRARTAAWPECLSQSWREVRDAADHKEGCSSLAVAAHAVGTATPKKAGTRCLLSLYLLRMLSM